MTRIRYAVAAGAAVLALVVGAAPATAATPTKLVATVGPSFTITLKKGGKKVTTLKAGRYTITVQDKSDFHNFHLMGPGGVNKKTTVSEVKTKTWAVTFKKGTYRYVCDPHSSQMKGSFKVT
jgi:plastocyanin